MKRKKALQQKLETKNYLNQVGSNLNHLELANLVECLGKYLYANELYNKKISQSDALTILGNIYNGKWNATTAKCMLVANQVGLNIK